ncbi:MAG: hypothetical protein CTY36_00040 [Methylocystis sp.]|nr:MAG: hypothetical protein CTY36_00040 [Methylocystis sp.]
MRLALVRNGVVENVILADADYAPEDGVLAVPAGVCGPGWVYDGETFHPPQESREQTPEPADFDAPI